MRIQILLAMVLAILSVNVAAADREKPKEQYLCVGEQTAGFKYNKNAKRWESTIFSNSGRYVISKATRSQAAFEITVVGNRYPSGRCEKGFTDYGDLSCNMFSGQLLFNKGNGRFILTKSFGYVEAGQEWSDQQENILTDDITDTPYMQIGKCSPF